MSDPNPDPDLAVAAPVDATDSSGSPALPSGTTPCDPIPANPLAWVVSEALRPDADIREALHLTYSADPTFFETHALGSLRSAGAAITVIADAGAYRADPRGVHRAGVDYAIGLAASHGAFHPKLNILVGPRRASFTVGSGNLSYGGWIGNDELATIFTADVSGTPSNTEPGSAAEPAEISEVFWQLADMLDLLSTGAVVTLGPTAGDAVRRCHDALRDLLATHTPTPSPHSLMSTLNGPLLPQLPQGRLSELILYAPFHDPGAQAVADLLKRYRPQRLLLGVQQEATVIEPDHLKTVAATYQTNLEVRSLGSLPYRHGKLIQAAALEPGMAWTLTGSPNLSVAALLRSADQPGGNVEIAVLTRQAPALLPAGHVISVDSIEPSPPAGTTSGDGDPATTFAQLLEARVEDGQIVLTLDRQAPAGLRVEVSPFENDPEVYLHLGDFPVGEQTAPWPSTTQAYDLTPRARFRLLDASDHRLLGGVIHLVDPDSVTSRMIRSSGRAVPHYTPASLFDDHGAAVQWERQMSELLATQTDAHATVRMPGGSSVTAAASGGVATFEDRDAWSRYYSFAIDRLGSPVVELALGALPNLGPHGSPTPPGRPNWRDMSEDELLEELEHDDQDTEAAAAQIHVEVRDQTDQQRKRYRTWLRRLVDGSPTLPLIDQMSRTALTLVGTTLDLWSDRTAEAGWFDLLLDATEQLHVDDPGTVPEPLRDAHASLVATCLYRLDEGLPDRRAASEHTRYAESVSRLGAIAHLATPDGISGRSKLIAPSNPVMVTEFIEAFVDRLRHADPLLDTLRLVEREHPDWTVELVSPSHVRVTGPFSDPSTPAAETLDAITRALPDGTAHAVTATGRRDVVRLARHHHLLSESVTIGNRVRYTAFDIGRGNAMGVRPDQGRRPSTRLPGPNSQPTSLVIDVCTAAGIEPHPTGND